MILAICQVWHISSPPYEEIMSFYPAPKLRFKKRMTKSGKRKMLIERRIKRGYEYKRRRYAKALSEWDRWNIVREQILLRDGGRCQLCGNSWNTEVHHIIPRGRGGTDDPRNLITLCWMCHRGGNDAVHLDIDKWIPILQAKIRSIYAGMKA